MNLKLNILKILVSLSLCEKLIRIIYEEFSSYSKSFNIYLNHNIELEMITSLVQLCMPIDLNENISWSKIEIQR